MLKLRRAEGGPGLPASEDQRREGIGPTVKACRARTICLWHRGEADGLPARSRSADGARRWALTGEYPRTGRTHGPRSPKHVSSSNGRQSNSGVIVPTANGTWRRATAMGMFPTGGAAPQRLALLQRVTDGQTGDTVPWTGRRTHGAPPRCSRRAIAFSAAARIGLLAPLAGVRPAASSPARGSHSSSAQMSSSASKPLVPFAGKSSAAAARRLSIGPLRAGISTGDEAQERELELHGGVPWVRGAAYATASCLLRPFRSDCNSALARRRCQRSVQAAFCAPVARARYRSILHCCAQQILAFRTDRGGSQRTDQKRRGDATGLEQFHPPPIAFVDLPRTRKSKITRAEFSRPTPHDSPADSAGAARHPRGPPGWGQPAPGRRTAPVARAAITDGQGAATTTMPGDQHDDAPARVGIDDDARRLLREGSQGLKLHNS